MSIPSGISPSESVVIVGSGPVGLAVATILKTINKDIKISVYDSRPDTTRKHGLMIEADTVKKMVSILDKQLLIVENKEKTKQISKKRADEFRSEINGLRIEFQGWSGKVVRTNEIEQKLGKKAIELGINVFRDEKYHLKESKVKLETDASDFQSALDNASVVIGADGAHSNVRKTVMKDKKESEKNLHFLVEIKYQTAAETKRRTNKDALKLSLKTGSVDFETMGGKGSEGESTKPATLHIAVSKSTYDKLRTNDKDGNQKGIFKNPWTEQEFAHLAKNDPEIESLKKIITAYEQDVKRRGGTLEDMKITTIPMNVYRSRRVATTLNAQQQIFLAGDASSGVVFGRGVNKGLQEAVLCAEAVSNHLTNNQTTGQSTKVHFAQKRKNAAATYEARQRRLFKKEKLTAEAKGLAIKVAKVGFLAFSKITVLFRK